MPRVPAPIQHVIDAINAGDLEAFVDGFTPDGHVDDWGRRLDGHEGIRSWGQSDAIGADAHMEVRQTATTGNTTTIEAEWQSTVFNGTSMFIFVLEGDKVRSLTIPSQ